MSAFFCRLDVHKKYTYATVLGPDGELIAQQKMNKEELPSFLKPHNVRQVAMEATTSIAPIYRKLVEEGYHVHVSHP